MPATSGKKVARSDSSYVPDPIWGRGGHSCKTWRPSISRGTHIPFFFCTCLLSENGPLCKRRLCDYVINCFYPEGNAKHHHSLRPPSRSSCLCLSTLVNDNPLAPSNDKHHAHLSCQYLQKKNTPCAYSRSRSLVFISTILLACWCRTHLDTCSIVIRFSPDFSSLSSCSFTISPSRNTLRPTIRSSPVRRSIFGSGNRLGVLCDSLRNGLPYCLHDSLIVEAVLGVILKDVDLWALIAQPSSATDGLLCRPVIPRVLQEVYVEASSL